MIVVFIPTYHNITCMCVPDVRLSLVRLDQHAQSLFLSSVSSLLKDLLTVSGLELEAAVRHEVFKYTLEGRVGGVRESTFAVDGGNDSGVLGAQVGQVHFFELGDVGGGQLVEVSTDTSVQDAYLLGSGHGHELVLLEELGELLTTVELLLGGNIEIGSKLGEGSDLTVLGKLELEGTGDLLHGLDLGGGTDTRDGETDVNGGADTLEEELGLKENLTVGNGDNVGGDIGRHITSLGLNNGQGGQRTTTVRCVHLGGALKETRMEIEDITGVSLTTRGSSEEEGHLSVSDGLLGQIVVDDEGVHAVVTEELTDGTSSIGGNELEGCGVGGGGSDDNGVPEGVLFGEGTHNVGNGGPLLSNSNIDAVELLVGIT